MTLMRKKILICAKHVIWKGVIPALTLASAWRNLNDSFKNNILSRGNTDHPMNLYVKFRGREPKVDALLKKSGLS